MIPKIQVRNRITKSDETLEVQSVIFEKKAFPTKEDCVKWATAQGFEGADSFHDLGEAFAMVWKKALQRAGFKPCKAEIAEGVSVEALLPEIGGVKKSWGLPKVGEAVRGAVAGMFSKTQAREEFLKAEIQAAARVRKFFVPGSDAPSRGPLAENKETFNGLSYSNLAPGTREFVNDEKDKNAAGQKVSKWGREVRISKMYAPKKIVIGEVYVPYDANDASTVDTHGHACSAEEIEKAAYEFMEALKNGKIDKQHNFVSGYGTLVESYIAKEGDPMFKPGSWIIGVKVLDDQVWSQIEKGEITGFSLAGSARLVEP